MSDHQGLGLYEVAPAAPVGDRSPHEDPAAEPCTVCPHSWAVHDALGRRFCTATREVGWARGCICR